ncbi:MAG: hypothetical protein Q9163_003394 [Psora crenata]
MPLAPSIILLTIQWTWMVGAWGLKVLPRASTLYPISVPPSQYWDGNDGPWSSFTLQVGTPIQDVRVFISTASPNTWVVHQDGCHPSDSSCPQARGGTFNPSTSTSWEQDGSYQFSFNQSLGLNVQGVFGNDTLGLGFQGGGGPILKDQIIAAHSSEELYLGIFGLNPSSTNFTETDRGRPSYLSSLKSQNLIPSLSYGYTAGNQYRLKKVYGSLTLGGYDSSLFTQNSVTIPFRGNPLRNLLVGIQSITAMGQNGVTSALLPTPVTANIDSTTPMIWLPTEACLAFEKAFGLTWNETADLYLVNDTLHDSLQNQNASITFTLGAATNGGQTTDITLPYDSFDLLIKQPFANVSANQRYFPLRRASDEGQYTLGRTVLQEAYLTVDWERQNFSISQCIFSDTAKQELVAITPLDTSPSGGLSTGATAGIAVGVILAAALTILALSILFLRRRNARRGAAAAEGNQEVAGAMIRQGFPKGELATDSECMRFEMEGSSGHANKGYGGERPDWLGAEARYPGNGSGVAEADVGVIRAEMAAGGGFYGGSGLHEMHDPSSTPPVELPGESPREEMEGSTPASSRWRSRMRRSWFLNPASPLSRPPSSQPTAKGKESSRSRPRSSWFGASSRGGNRHPVPSGPSSPYQRVASAGSSSR